MTGGELAGLADRPELAEERPVAKASGKPALQASLLRDVLPQRELTFEIGDALP